MNSIRMKRIYEEPTQEDGYRILVDRLWPRGISKSRANLDKWAKEISPSTNLRKEFNHMPGKIDSFRVQYVSELDSNADAMDFVQDLREQLASQNVTLLYAAKDEQVNHAVILKEWLESAITTTDHK
jgi:uncharacterized protein YeaO (DUF488 family)